MIDFTLETYHSLIKSLIFPNYKFLTAEEYFSHSVSASHSHSVVIMRHDIDRKPHNALRMAKLENELGVTATYYFRTIPKTFKPDIIKEIASLDHEIGYHYENMDVCKGDIDLAYEDFKLNIDKLRKIYPVKTICMHGSPISKWDNRLLWDKFDYKNHGIIAEPYFDVDFSKVFYLTDTGRRWNGEDVSIRDKVTSDKENYSVSSRQNSKFTQLRFHSTNGIIRAIEDNRFPAKAMITVHPQRWTNNPILWTKELAWQNTKNFIKKHFFIRK